MAISLKPVDVAVIGLGAAGGVAVLPLARAGLKVAGLEAGTWMDPHSFKPDELHNNVRGLLTSVPKAQSRSSHRSQQPVVAHAARRDSSHDERDRRHVHSLLGAELAAQSLGLQDPQRSCQALRPGRYSARDRRSKTGPSLTTISNRTTTSSSTKSACRGKPETFKAASIRWAMFSKLRGSASIRCRRCAAAASPITWPRRRSSSAGNRFVLRRRSTRRSIRAAQAAFFTAIAAAAGATSAPRILPPSLPFPRPVKTKNLTITDLAQVTRIVAGSDGRVTGVNYMKDGKEYFQPAKVVLLASYTYENSRLLLLSQSKAVSQGSREQSRPSGPPLFRTLAERRDGAVPVRHQYLVRDAGAGGCGGRFRRRQLRSFRPRLHRRHYAAAAHRDASHRSGIAPHVRPSAWLGIALESFRARKRSALGVGVYADLQRFRTKTSIWIWIPRCAIRWAIRSAASPRRRKKTNREPWSTRRKRWRSGSAPPGPSR